MLSIPHLIIIFVVALVVFGPEKLPELARNFGKFMAEFRRATGDLRSTFDEHMRELERESQAIEHRKREVEAREAALRVGQSAPVTPALPADPSSDSPVEAAPPPANGAVDGTVPHESPSSAK